MFVVVTVNGDVSTLANLNEGDEQRLREFAAEKSLPVKVISVTPVDSLLDVMWDIDNDIETWRL